MLPTFTADQIKLLIHYKPTTDFQRRLHLLILVLLDTGARISEVLGLQASDIDLDNMLLTLHGKGSKDRKVPFSFHLRKVLFKYLDGRKGRLFLTANQTPWTRLGALKSVKLQCQKLGFQPPARTIHALRHTYAINAIRRGASVFHVQKQLGHSTLDMTRRYCNLITDDLSAVHQQSKRPVETVSTIT